MDNRDTSDKIKPSLLREYEFFGGCIRVKISVKNTSSLAILDAALELESDEKVLHFDRCEPEYPEKKGKIQLGNINPNTDRTIAFYLDPLICAKEGTDVNCRVSFKDAFGRPDSVQMETLKIKVVCPIFRTEQDVNIGRLKELVSGLQFHDSKVYTIPKKVEISELLGTCRNVIQLHDVRHIKTFKTTDEKTYEAWYYGKTKVTKKDLVIKCSVQRDTESIEVFAAGNDPSDITGLLAEIGRNLTREFEKLGKVQPVFNIHIKDSIIQRSNLLSFCNLDGTCGGDVVIEDSVVQRANIASWNEAAQKEGEEREKNEQEDRALRERKAREDAEIMESERLKAKQEDERIEKEREKLSVSEKKEGISQIKYLAVALMLGVVLIGYWTMAPASTPTPTPIHTPTPTVIATTVQIPTVGGEKNTIGVIVQTTLKNNIVPDKIEIIDKSNGTIVKSVVPSVYTTIITGIPRGTFTISVTKSGYKYSACSITPCEVTFTTDYLGSKTVTIILESLVTTCALNVYVEDKYRKPPKTETYISIDGKTEQLAPNGNLQISEITKGTHKFSVRTEGYKGITDENRDITCTTTPEVITFKLDQTEEIPVPESITLSVNDQKTITNSIGMEFVLIPAGEFDMGSPSNEKDRDADEGPVHRVKIAKAFYMGKYEVTQKQWRDVMGNNPSDFKGDNLPVESVSWYDVQEFIQKLNEKEGTNKYRPPSEAEWEYAARAGTTTRYSFGDDESKLGDYAWYDANSGSTTHRVGQKKPNPWGLYDMQGNVWEWVQDSWHSNYNGAPTDGGAWDGDGLIRHDRGGGWDGYARGYRSADRGYVTSIERYGHLGFRLVRVS